MTKVKVNHADPGNIIPMHELERGQYGVIIEGGYINAIVFRNKRDNLIYSISNLDWCWGGKPETKVRIIKELNISYTI